MIESVCILALVLFSAFATRSENLYLQNGGVIILIPLEFSALIIGAMLP
jgi:hypothetical protein